VSKTLSKIGGFVIGAALIAVGLTVPGMQGLIFQGAAMIVTQAVYDLTAPKTPARQASEMSIQLGETPRVVQFGETFTPGSLVDGFNYGGKYGTDWEVLIIRLADHKCHSLVSFYVNDEINSYTGDGDVQRYDGKFKIYFRGDTTNDPLPDIVLDNGIGWTSADIGQSGCDVIVAYKADKPDAKHPVWPGGRPRFGFVIRGKLCYDPRLDDTVTGGAGAHRWDDASTWEWSENAVVCWYNYERGIYADDDTSDQSKLLVGRGLTAEESPPEYIFANANLCDEIAATVFPVDARATVQSNGSTFILSADSPFMAYADGNFELWHLPTRTKVGDAYGTADAGLDPHWYDIAPDGTVYYAARRVVGVDLQATLYTTPRNAATTSADYSDNTIGRVRVFDDGATREILTGSPSAGYHSGTLFVAAAASCRDFFRHGDGGKWAVTHPTGSSNQIGLLDLATGTHHVFTGLVTRGSPGTAQACHVESAGHFFVESDGKFYIVDDSTFTVTASGAIAWTAGHLPVKDPARTSLWDGFDEWSLIDGSHIRDAASGDWDAAATYRSVYDPFNHAIISRPQFNAELDFLMLDRHGAYRVAGPVYSTQEFLEVEEMFANATAGNLVTHEGALELEPGQAKSVSSTFTDDDLIVGSTTTYNQGFLSESSGEWLNSVVANYIEPEQKWNAHDAPIARDTDDIIADGKPREATVTLRLVRYLEQAQRIAEISRRKGRLWGRAQVTLGPRFCEIEAGDWVTWTSDRYNFTKTFEVRAGEIDEKWQNRLTLAEINGSVFADDADFTTDQSRAAPPPIIPDIGAPTDANWTATATTLTSTGASIPAISVTGSASDDDHAEAIIVEYWKDDGVGDPVADPDSVDWIMAGRYAPTATQIDITSIVGGGTYYTAISYVVGGVAGDRLVLGPVTAGSVDVSGQVTPAIAGAVAALAWKQPVRAATTANATLSSAFEDGDTIDGVVLVTGDRILIKNQTTASENGIYVVNASGAPSRAADADSGSDFVGATVKVSEGTTNADQEWSCTTNAPIVVGATALTFARPTVPAPTETFILACSDETTGLATGNAKITFRIPYAFTLTEVRASLTTAQASGSIFTVDINEGGASVLSTKLSIDNTEKTSTTAVTPAVISDAALANDAEITVDIDQVGDGTAKGLKVSLIGHQ
jgi:hypothetical protein